MWVELDFPIMTLVSMKTTQFSWYIWRNGFLSVCLKSFKINNKCWKNKFKTLEIFNKCKSLASGRCFLIIYERDNSQRIVRHLEGRSTPIALLVALDSHIDQALSDIRQEETPITELTLIEISLD